MPAHCPWFALAAALSLLIPGSARAQTTQEFEVAGHRAFLMLPKGEAATALMPWVWYAPTLPGLPGEAEQWMFDRLLAAGIAIAGIDVGESYGNPSGRAAFTALHRHLVEQRGLAPRACLLARSRGGLMLYNWAAEHPESVAGIAGIYPVCSLESYPGLAKACGAYAMTVAELQKALPEHDPIARLAPLAAARVPIFHIHGDSDHVVPLESNSAELHRRYTKLGGPMHLETVAGRGHDMWPGWFQCQALVDFVIERARTTGGIIDIAAATRPAKAMQLIGPDGSLLVPEKADAACQWVFADGVLTASPAWDSVITTKPYRDFRMHIEFNVNAAHGKDPEANGNSGIYIQQRYELQILDSFGFAAADYKESFCGSLYRLKKPDRLANKPAGEWQSFDIAFRAARYEGATKVRNARITAYQNGVLIHDDCEIPRKTGAGQPEGPSAAPIKLQGHHNPVRFRDFWIVE